MIGKSRVQEQLDNALTHTEKTQEKEINADGPATAAKPRFSGFKLHGGPPHRSNAAVRQPKITAKASPRAISRGPAG